MPSEVEYGYKALMVIPGMEGGIVLASPYFPTKWSTSLLRSNWNPVFGSFETSAKGIYSTKEPSQLVPLYYSSCESGVVARLIPVGKTVHGTRGYRSESALIDSIYLENYKTCYRCGRRVPPHLLRIADPSGLGRWLVVCKEERARNAQSLPWLDVPKILKRKYKVPIKVAERFYHKHRLDWRPEKEKGEWI